MPKASLDQSKVDELREREQLEAILLGLEENADKFKVPTSLVGELRSYINIAKSIPKRVTVEDKKSVIKAQEALQKAQAWLDRVLVMQFYIFRVTRALHKAEILARADLTAAGVISKSTSAAAAKVIMASILPELAILQEKWKALEKLCSAVQSHLGDAKDTMRLQIRLDENANWNRRYSGG